MARSELNDPAPGDVVVERDLYRALLRLGSEDELETFLAEALGLVMKATDSDRGYLELRDAFGHDDEVWFLAKGIADEEVDEVRARISTGIIAEALLTGSTVTTSSALLDARFESRESVRASGIQAVLCAPVGRDVARGVVYLERDRAQPFSAEAREGAELFATHLAPLADRILSRRRVLEATDPTRELRTRFQLDGIVGRSPAIARALEQAMLAAPLEVNVLLTGASGTGKSQLAHAIHRNSRRAGAPFVELNCAAIPPDLSEAELFGTVPGGFTGAHDRAGAVGASQGGTLFLDEIGELPLAVQPKLLQLLQSRNYTRVGSDATLRADVRIVAATNVDLDAAVAEGRFREDLFFRLDVLPIVMPPLAERREDLPELVAVLLAKIARENGLPELRASDALLLAIRTSDWPGNIRQLENAMTGGAVRAAASGSAVVEREHVFAEVTSPHDGEDPAPSFREATRRFQRELLLRTLRQEDWNVAATARALDLTRQWTHELIRSFGLDREEDR